MQPNYHDISKMIDHALLVPTLTQKELESGCQMAVAYDVASVCIMPFYLERCAEILADSTVAPSTTIGFPQGGQKTATKVTESELAISDGCQELDMVVNISKVLSGDWRYVTDDIAAVIDVAHAAHRKVKVIFENCYLTDEQKVRLCQICSEWQADWVKTSTGFGTGGATLADLQLMCAHTPDSVQVKAAGGVRDIDKALEVRSLGVTRIGTSGTAGILDPWRARLGLPKIMGADAASSGY